MQLRPTRTRAIEMANIKNIVLTGGPCAGKTTALARIIQHFTYRGYAVYAQPEAATLFNQAGVNFLTGDKRLFFDGERVPGVFPLEKEQDGDRNHLDSLLVKILQGGISRVPDDREIAPAEGADERIVSVLRRISRYAIG